MVGRGKCGKRDRKWSGTYRIVVFVVITHIHGENGEED